MRAPSNNWLKTVRPVTACKGGKARAGSARSLTGALGARATNFGGRRKQDRHTLNAIKTTVIIVLAVVSVLPMGCTERDRAALGDMVSLRNAVKEHYSCEDVGIVFWNGHVLQMTLVNSPYPDKSRQELKATAADLAQFASEHYASIGTVDTIEVVFTQSRTRYFVITTHQKYGPFSFTKSVSGDGVSRWQSDAKAGAPPAALR